MSLRFHLVSAAAVAVIGLILFLLFVRVLGVPVWLFSTVLIVAPLTGFLVYVRLHRRRSDRPEVQPESTATDGHQPI